MASIIGEQTVKLKNMKNLLWISLCAPFDGVGHAGGKNENFYLKSLLTRSDVRIKLLTTEVQKFEAAIKDDYKKYNLDAELIIADKGFRQKVLYRLLSLESKFNIFNRYGGFCPNKLSHNIITKLKSFKRKGYIPDVIILEWTQIGVLASRIKRIFPAAKIIIFEEDVAFLGLERRVKLSKGLKKAIANIRYKKLKKAELHCLNIAENVIVNNVKDYNLLLKSGIEEEKIVVIPVYFDNYQNIQRQIPNNDIIFLGAMAREENWRSMIWFIENVFNKIDGKYRLIIIGGNPNEALRNYQSERVILTGFVKDITDYLKNSLCFVSPLILGAGIKVKNIEALSSGIPLLTNEIGIEGIPAQDNIDYFHCEDPIQYIEIINKLSSNQIDYKYIEKNAKRCVNENFNLEKGKEDLYKLVVT